MSACRCAFAVSLWLGVASLAHPQTAAIQKKIAETLKEKKKEEAKLGELLEEALKNNPDVRAADAKVREAEADLHRIRIRVLNRVVSLQAEIAAARAATDEAKTRYERAKRLYETKVVALEELSSAEVTLQKFKAEQARLEAELPYLLGKLPAGAERLAAMAAFSPDVKVRWGVAPGGGTFVDRGPAGMVGAAEKPAGDGTAETIRRALDGPVRIDVKDSGLREVLDVLKGTAKGVNFLLAPSAPVDQAATLKLQEPIPLGAALQLIEDQFGVVCIVRDYGIVFTDRSGVPPGAVGVIDFWKHRAPTTPLGSVPGMMAPGGMGGGPMGPGLPGVGLPSKK